MYFPLFYLELVNSNLVAEKPNPAVSSSVLDEIWKWKKENASTEDLVQRLRLRTVPIGCQYHNWKSG